jgi:hypothetical protein
MDRGEQPSKRPDEPINGHLRVEAELPVIGGADLPTTIKNDIAEEATIGSTGGVNIKTGAGTIK